MTNWHPTTKFIALAGVFAIAVLLLTGESDNRSGAVAALPSPLSGIEDENSQSVPEELSRQYSRQLPSKEALANMVERPLFAPSRRPFDGLDEGGGAFYESEDWASEPGEHPEPEMAFVGSLLHNEKVLALITRGYYGSIESISVGEEIDGWKVLDIGDTAISLGHEDRRVQYRIFD